MHGTSQKEQAKLRTEQIGNVDNVDGLKVLVTKEFPKYFKINPFNFHFKSLSPSKGLLRHFFEFRDLEYFRKCFYEEMDNEVSQEKISFIKNLLDDNHNVTLFCCEPEGYFCHRHLLVEIILKMNLGIHTCPYFLMDDAKRRCILKKHNKYIGRPEICDFYGFLFGNGLKRCALFCEKTKYFRCKTCVFNKSICLLGRNSGSIVGCNSWVEKNLKFGNMHLLYMITQKGFMYEELKI